MTPEDTALADRLEAPGNTDGPVDPKAVYRTKPVALFEEAARRLRELGAEVEELEATQRALEKRILQCRALEARISELEAERAWRPTCETCIHWKFDEPDWEFDKLRFGECKAIHMREHIADTARDGLDRFSPECDAAEEAALATAKAIAVDGSGYYAAVRTAPDFGCTLHSPLPIPPTERGAEETK